jgi:mannose-6-phosphate isomerase-like protein (cupin superfamily)
MIIQRKDMRLERKENMRGGEKTVNLLHLVPPNTEKNMRLMAEITIPPGGSIGYHEHAGETEYFIILSGRGMVNDNGVEKAVAAGDVISTGGGAAHSIANTGVEALVLHAVIVTLETVVSGKSA